jgi:hypothetical protein
MFAFSSSLPSACRRDLEALLFFNPRQHHVHGKIIEAVRRFGAPEIVADGDRLRIEARGFEGLQTLYALEDSGSARPKLCGVVMYVREDAETLFIVHIAVLPSYSMFGKHAGKGLTFRMIEEVRGIARRIKGVKGVKILYLRGVVQRLPV